MILKERLEAERVAAVGNTPALTAIAFNPMRVTAAQTFDKSVSKTTTQDAIESTATFTEVDQAKLDEISALLTAGATTAADVSALATWAGLIATECETGFSQLSDAALSALSKLKADTVSAREAARLAAEAMFTDEPLRVWESESWRELWKAARDYSVSEAYVGRDYPVTALEEGSAACVLCQQPLLDDAAARMIRFQKFIDDTLDVAAIKAEEAVADAESGLAEFKLLGAADFADRLKQVRNRDADLATALSSFQSAVVARRADAIARLAGNASATLATLISPVEAAKALAEELKSEKEALAKAGNSDERAKLTAEKAELEDRKILAANRERLLTRRQLLISDATYEAALAEVQTKGITQRANELLDTHLTTAVVDRFDAERARLDIMHLKVSLARKSGQTQAEFEVDPQTKLTKVTSEILSEGEQRALALAGFLTEVLLTDGPGPIIVDDPVSSLDRDRSARVADRIVEEGLQRQVVVFTHDIIFFNELYRAADAVGIEPVTIALFSDTSAAGKIDPAGMVWKSLNVAKRIGKLRNDLAPIAKLHSTSPADYEYQIKNLYGRLRDTYERVVEEIIFQDIVRRGSIMQHNCYAMSACPTR